MAPRARAPAPKAAQPTFGGLLAGDSLLPPGRCPLSARSSQLKSLGLWILVFAALVGAYAGIHAAFLDDIKFSRNDTEVIKIYLIGFGIMLAVGRWAWLRWMAERADGMALWSRRLLAFLMLVLCLAATMNYGRYGTKLIAERIDVYDVIHYYLGPKYFDEIGYFDLYAACIIADDEAGMHFEPAPPTYQHQDIDGYEIRPYRAALARTDEIKGNFEPERWDAFVHDFTTLQREFYGLEKKYWYQLVNDHGFNGTPAWAGYAAPLVNLVEAQDVKLICYADIAVLLVSIGVAWWAFGGWSAAFLWFFLLTTYSTRWPTISWAILRYDYVAAMIIATAMVKKGRPVLAGIFAGHTAAMRLFPATYLYGPGVQGAWKLVRHRKLDKFAVLFFVGVVAWVGALQLNFAGRFGAEHIAQHWTGMTDHMAPENLSSRRLGMAIALAYRGETDEPWSFGRIDRVERQEPVRKGIALVILLALGWALRKCDRAEAYAMGFIAFFALATASYYYFVVRAPLILVHAAGLNKPRHMIALAFLLGIDLFANMAQQLLGGNRIFVVGWMGWTLLAYCLGMIAVLIWESHTQTTDSEPEPA
jgi:hypothetical protein